MITKDINFNELLKKYPQATGILMRCGMHCLGCHSHSSQEQTLEEACKAHRMDVDIVLDALNKGLE